MCSKAHGMVHNHHQPWWILDRGPAEKSPPDRVQERSSFIFTVSSAASWAPLGPSEFAPNLGKELQLGHVPDPQASPYRGRETTTMVGACAALWQTRGWTIQHSTCVLSINDSTYYRKHPIVALINRENTTVFGGYAIFGPTHVVLLSPSQKTDKSIPWAICPKMVDTTRQVTWYIPRTTTTLGPWIVVTYRSKWKNFTLHFTRTNLQPQRRSVKNRKILVTQENPIRWVAILAQ